MMIVKSINSSNQLASLGVFAPGVYCARGIALITFGGAPTDVDWSIGIDFRSESNWLQLSQDDYAGVIEWGSHELPTLARHALNVERVFLLTRDCEMFIQGFASGSGSPSPDTVGWGVESYFEIIKV